MTSRTVCCNCQGELTIYERGDGTLGGRCPTCGKYVVEAMPGYRPPESDPEPERPFVDWEREQGITLPPMTLIRIKRAEEQADAIAEFIAYLESTCGVRMTLIDQTKDTAYIHTAGYLSGNDYGHKLAELGIRYDVASGPVGDPLRRLAQ